MSVSVAALTDTVCAVFQFVVVKVNVSWSPDEPAFVSNVTSVLPPEARATVTVTLPLGCVFSRTV